jgi:hypothetical protein
MAVTKCPIPAHTVSEFTMPPRATRQCGRTGRLDSPFAGLIEKTMSKTSTFGHHANEYRALQDTEVAAVTDGTLNKAPKLYDAC